MSVARAAIAAGALMLLLGAAAMLSGSPLLFPAIGASAAVVCLAPRSEGARPRSILVGHLVGAVLGWACVQALAAGEPASLAGALDLRHMLSGALALGLTAAALLALRIPHPPAAATTMIVGMGLLPRATHVAAIVVSAALTAALVRLCVRASAPQA